jgi:hypothetical protein
LPSLALRSAFDVVVPPDLVSVPVPHGIFDEPGRSEILVGEALDARSVSPDAKEFPEIVIFLRSGHMAKGVKMRTPGKCELMENVNSRKRPV